MGYSLGIDLGTTYTAAAVSEGRHAEIVPLGDRSPQAPSVLYRAPDGSLRYGEAAERHAAAEPERIAREFKRRMGDQTPIFVAGSPMSAHALSKALLGWTVGRVTEGQGEPPDRVIVTCPANWGPYRRELMSQVTSLNADYPIEVCTEPEAAAVHFAATRRVAVGQAIAVYDLGGGTFDAAVLRRTSDGGFELLGTPDGIEQLGGVDFDDAVFGRVSRGIEWDRLDPEDPETMAGLARLRRDCTDAKEALSSETEATVPVMLGGRLNRVRLTRGEFEELITPLVEDTVEILERVIRRSGVMPHELAAIVLVGGSSRVPLVSELITRRFGRPAVLSPQPKLCVAMGAGLLAGAIEPAAMASAPGAVEDRPTTRIERMPVETPGPAAAPGQVGLLAAVAPAPPAVTGPPAPPAGRTPQPAPAPGPIQTSPDPTATSARRESAGEPTGEPAGAPATIVAPPRGGQHRRLRPTYPLVAALFAVAAVALMIFGPPVRLADQRSWNDQFMVTAAGLPPAATLTPTLFGIAITHHPDNAADGVFDLSPKRLFLSGPMRGTIDVAGEARPVLLSAEQRWSASRFLSLPFAALVLTGLFSFAYAESILRPIRRRHARGTAGELVGLVGSGLVAGVAAVLATWVIGNRLPEVGTALGIVVCTCASIGLLAFAWPARQAAD
ncbi:Hsp70 family protein [Microlunatus ginsengisoli]|uniref:Hsp70 protein n=1 Tax=Microlunatus ginsengisoli TaxID=363863 RepID=A0ABP7AS96_9ACTN